MLAFARRTAALTLLTGFSLFARASADVSPLPISADPEHPPTIAPASVCTATGQPEPAIDKAAWLVTVHTEGGYVGRGAGNYAARSDGTIWADGCIAHPDAATFAKVTAAVAGAHDASWSKSYREKGDECCDQIYTTLTVVRANGRRQTIHSAAFSSASEETTPAGYRTLLATLYGVARAYESRVR